MAATQNTHKASKVPADETDHTNAVSGQKGVLVRSKERGATLHIQIETAVSRLAEIVDEETIALQSGIEGTDFKSLNSRKSIGLVELNRAIGLLGKNRPPDKTVELIEQLNRKLEANRHVLKLQMEAVGEIATIISQSIRGAESDGTYTHSFRSKGHKL